jgi:hypothetical protein
MVPAAEAERLHAELAEANERERKLAKELENARARTPQGDTSVEVSTCEEIPPILDCRPLGPEDQRALDDVMTAWAISTVRAALLGASPVVQERFIPALRADIAGSRTAGK